MKYISKVDSEFIKNFVEEHIDLKFKEIILDTVESRACLNNFGFRYVNSLTYSKNIVPFEIISNTNINIDKVDYNIDGFEFEHFSKDLLLADGFESIEVTKASGFVNVGDLFFQRVGILKVHEPSPPPLSKSFF